MTHLALVAAFVLGSVSAVLRRNKAFALIFLLGFSTAALTIYVFLVATQATFIHANVRWTFRRVRKIIAAFHHWHHSAEREAVDKNFAVHTPIWDALFGTYYLPDRWPSRYGLSGGPEVPSGWVRQMVHPLRGRR
jgi:sterol desaturase/sphingolipid hydroxylase (fatty acid hydroxylase superfamily)